VFKVSVLINEFGEYFNIPSLFVDFCSFNDW